MSREQIVVEVVSQVVEALRPLKGVSEDHYDGDTVGPDGLVREVVRAALAELEVDGLNGCRLCLS